MNMYMICYCVHVCIPSVCAKCRSCQGAKNLRSRFEDMARSADEEDHRRAEEERQRRLAQEQREKSEVTKRVSAKFIFSCVLVLLLVNWHGLCWL